MSVGWTGGAIEMLQGRFGCPMLTGYSLLLQAVLPHTFSCHPVDKGERR